MRPFLQGVIAAAGVFITAIPGLAENLRERPILVRVDDMLRGYSHDGTALFDVGDYWAPSWAPDGGRFLVLVPHGRFHDPAVIDLSGPGRYLFPEETEGTYLYRPIWSPDGRSIALIRYAPSGFAFVVVDAETAEIRAEGKIPEKFTADFPYYTAGVDTFSWSPDSKKLILSWEGVLVFNVDSEKVQVASDQFALAFWPPDSGGVCVLQYESEGPNPIVLGYLRRFELETGILRDIATPKDLASAGIDLAKWLHVGAIQLSPDGTSVALSMGNLATESDAIRIYDASVDCIEDLTQPRQVIETDLVPVMDWAPDGGALVLIEEVESTGPAYSFEVRVINFKTHDRVPLVGFELEWPDVEVLTLLGFLAWSR